MAGDIIQSITTDIAGSNLDNGDVFSAPGVPSTFFPLPLWPGFPVVVSSGSVWEGGWLEFLLFFGAFLSMKTAIISATTTNKLFITTLTSGVTLPAAQSCSNSCFTRSISSHTLSLFIVAMDILYHRFF
jgi:hypothetical protein